MTDVRWKPIKGYGKKYRVSSHYGIIQRRLKSGEYTELKYGWHKDGYQMVSLYKNGKHKRTTVHRVVAEAFLPNPDKLGTVNHINGNKTDNCTDNLEWLEHEDNLRHAHKTGLIAYKIGEDRHISKHTNSQVIEIKKMLRDGFRNKEICQKLNVKPWIVHDIKIGKSWGWLKI